MRTRGARTHRAVRSAAALAALLVALTGCAGEEEPAATTAPISPVVPPNLTEALGEPTPPDGLTTEPRENELAIRCGDGLLEWCDLVFTRVSPATAVWRYVASCGGRLPGRPELGVTPSCRLRDDPPQLNPTEAPDADDPELERLATECEADELDACDDLWAASEVGSELEQYGATCGGRSDDRRPGTCLGLLGVPDGEPPGDLGVDSKLNGLALECFHGQLDSCDDLFVDADRESDYRPYAASCGGRLQHPSEQTLPDCRRRFADPVALTEPDPFEGEPGAPELMELADECFDADMVACDQLYARAPDHSDLEVYGQTCGARFQDTDIDLHFVAPGQCDALVIANPGDEATSDLT